MMSSRQRPTSISEMIVQPEEEGGMYLHHEILLKFLFSKLLRKYFVLTAANQVCVAYSLNTLLRIGLDSRIKLYSYLGSFFS